jgi:hypothetical protein
MPILINLAEGRVFAIARSRELLCGAMFGLLLMVVGFLH